jgi:hypothetical protein
VKGSCPHPPPSCEFISFHVIRSGIYDSSFRRIDNEEAPGYGSLCSALFELEAEGTLPPENSWARAGRHQAIHLHLWILTRYSSSTMPKHKKRLRGKPRRGSPWRPRRPTAPPPAQPPWMLPPTTVSLFLTRSARHCA